MKFKCKFVTYIYFVLLLTLVSACASGVDDSLSEYDLIFTGYLEDTQNLKTRFDSKYIEGGGEYSQNYYIELFCTPPGGEPVPKYGIYDIPSGYSLAVLRRRAYTYRHTATPSAKRSRS